jgi:hypothetical protein
LYSKHNNSTAKIEPIKMPLRSVQDGRSKALQDRWGTLSSGYASSINKSSMRNDSVNSQRGEDDRSSPAKRNTSEKKHAAAGAVLKQTIKRLDTVEKWAERCCSPSNDAVNSALADARQIVDECQSHLSLKGRIAESLLLSAAMKVNTASRVTRENGRPKTNKAETKRVDVSSTRRERIHISTKREVHPSSPESPTEFRLPLWALDVIICFQCPKELAIKIVKRLPMLAGKSFAKKHLKELPYEHQSLISEVIMESQGSQRSRSRSPSPKKLSPSALRTQSRSDFMRNDVPGFVPTNQTRGRKKKESHSPISKWSENHSKHLGSERASNRKHNWNGSTYRGTPRNGILGSPEKVPADASPGLKSRIQREDDVRKTSPPTSARGNTKNNSEKGSPRREGKGSPNKHEYYHIQMQKERLRKTARADAEWCDKHSPHGNSARNFIDSLARRTSGHSHRFIVKKSHAEHEAKRQMRKSRADHGAHQHLHVPDVRDPAHVLHHKR